LVLETKGQLIKGSSFIWGFFHLMRARQMKTKIHSFLETFRFRKGHMLLLHLPISHDASRLSLPIIFNQLVRCPQYLQGEREQIANCQNQQALQTQISVLSPPNEIRSPKVKEGISNLRTDLCNPNKNFRNHILHE
jgi:hypothetical protein